ncbi:hypothetical protein HQN64_01110 [Enterobacteriaceae bacterium BIT-l23]|uniref:hypothetical protein n=1 Tax=Jejubacter sp. L23 TaxID=3092086 RepID=UPI0015845492|nr:hypothetical protein [Enterobacteriaceae bacterium BIT-l23]
MSWPVRIILPEEPVPVIRWKWWVGVLLCILMLIALAGVSIQLIDTSERKAYGQWILFVLVVSVGCYFLLVALRVYFYGMRLTASEAYKKESLLLKQTWTRWASKSVIVSTHHLFVPAEISLQKIVSEKPVDVYKGQSLKLSDNDYTEEQVFYELLSSIRVTLKELSTICTFDVIFLYESSYSSFSLFKSCWSRIGLSEEKLTDNACFSVGNYADCFEKIVGSESNRVSVVISINIEGREADIELGTEFASITLMSSRNYFTESNDCNAILRPMICRIVEVEEALSRMKTYQPEICNVSSVFFSGMPAGDIMAINDVLYKSFSKELKWQDLNMAMGNLAGEHLGLVLPFALYYANFTKKSVLMISKLKDKCIINVVKPVFINKETEN